MSEKQARSTEILKKISKKASRPLVVSELLEQLMAIWGGPQQFATAFHTEFSKAPMGGMIRARMLSDVFSLFRIQTMSQKGDVNSVEDMTDADLNAVLKDAINAPGDPS